MSQSNNRSGAVRQRFANAQQEVGEQSRDRQREKSLHRNAANQRVTVQKPTTFNEAVEAKNRRNHLEHKSKAAAPSGNALVVNQKGNRRITNSSQLKTDKHNPILIDEKSGDKHHQVISVRAQQATGSSLPKTPRCYLPRCLVFNRYESQLVVRTLTCNKLSHCLFDFDCADFSVYEQESYNYQEFHFKKLRHDQYTDPALPPTDYLISRDGIKVTCTPVIEGQLRLKWKNQVVLRFIMKHQDGRLWAYNKPFLDQSHFNEVPNQDGTGVIKTVYKETKAKREADEDEENDVDLSRSMWLIIRKKRSINQVLKDFFPDYQSQMVRVRDIVKFGRVNFKISALQCDKIDPVYNGTCYQPPNTTRSHSRSAKSEDNQDDAEDAIGPMNAGTVTIVDDRQINTTNNVTRTQVDNSLEINQNLTEMNLVNDVTGTASNSQLLRLRNDLSSQSQVDLTNIVPEQSQSQIELLREATASGSTSIPLAAGRNVRNQGQATAQNQPIKKLTAGTGGPPDVSHQSLSEIERIKDAANNQVDGSKILINQNSESADASAREMVCRICLSEQEPGNQLICPCKCSGSMGQIHVTCLKEWLNSKRLVYEGTKVTSYFWKALECELCKAPFEDKMRSSMFAIMQFDKPDKNYMILESIKSAPAKVVHVFDLRFDSFKVGRSVETDMKIADISVSRTHSFFKIKDNKIVVEDNGSKFGTLVKLQRPVDLLNAKGEITSTIFQVGRTLIYLQLNTDKQRKLQCQRRPAAAEQLDPHMAAGSGPYDNYLQLRKDAMRVPQQFYFKGRSSNKSEAFTPDLDNYFSFHAATEEAKDDRSNGEVGRRGQSIGGGHPLVPKLNLPRPDPNDEWREMMAQAQSYEVESSSLQSSVYNNGPSESSDQYNENQAEDGSSSGSDEEEEDESEFESEESEEESVSQSASDNQNRGKDSAVAGASASVSRKSNKKSAKSRASKTKSQTATKPAQANGQIPSKLRHREDGVLTIEEEKKGQFYDAAGAFENDEPVVEQSEEENKAIVVHETKKLKQRTAQLSSKSQTKNNLVGDGNPLDPAANHINAELEKNDSPNAQQSYYVPNNFILIKDVPRSKSQEKTQSRKGKRPRLGTGPSSHLRNKSRSIKPNHMADLDRALAAFSRNPSSQQFKQQAPNVVANDNIQTLKIAGNSGKAVAGFFSHEATLHQNDYGQKNEGAIFGDLKDYESQEYLLQRNNAEKTSQNTPAHNLRLTTKVIQLQSSQLADGKSPIKVPEALNNLALESLSGDNDTHNNNNVHQEQDDNSLYNNQILLSEVKNEHGINEIPHERSEQPRLHHPSQSELMSSQQKAVAAEAEENFEQQVQLDDYNTDEQQMVNSQDGHQQEQKLVIANRNDAGDFNDQTDNQAIVEQVNEQNDKADDSNNVSNNNVFAENLEASGGSNQVELVSNLHNSNELIFEEADNKDDHRYNISDYIQQENQQKQLSLNNNQLQQPNEMYFSQGFNNNNHNNIADDNGISNMASQTQEYYQQLQLQLKDDVVINQNGDSNDVKQQDVNKHSFASAALVIQNHNINHDPNSSSGGDLQSSSMHSVHAINFDRERKLATGPQKHLISDIIMDEEAEKINQKIFKKNE